MKKKKKLLTLLLEGDGKMMKKLLVLMLVLGLASSASALVVDLRADDVDTLAVTLTPLSPTVEVSMYSDTGVAGNYFRVLTVDTAGTAGGIGTFTALTPTANAGPDASVTTPYFYSWAYLIEAKDADPGTDPPLVAGEHFSFDYTATLFDGSQQIIDLRVRDQAWTLIESMVITQIPEPTTIALLGLGSLFLRRRRK